MMTDNNEAMGGSRLRRRSFFEEEPPQIIQTTTNVSVVNADESEEMFLSSPSPRSTRSFSTTSNNGLTESVEVRTTRRYTFAAQLRTAIISMFQYLNHLLTIQRGRIVQSIGSISRQNIPPTGPSSITYVYPTKSLNIAIFSLLILQLALFVNFQQQHMDLQVTECVFQPHLLSSISTAHRDTSVMALSSSSPIMQNLLKRFDDAEVARRDHITQLNFKTDEIPSTCIAIFPDPNEDKLTHSPNTVNTYSSHRYWVENLKLLLPRSHVIDYKDQKEVNTIARLQLKQWDMKRVFHGNSDLIELKVVRGLILPITKSSVNSKALDIALGTYLRELSTASAPDIIFVQTESSLKSALRVRSTIASHGSYNYGVYLLKTTIPGDPYDRTIAKDWTKFLHVVTLRDDNHSGRTQFTREILTIWADNPDLPLLIVRFSLSLSLCRSFQQYFNTLRYREEKVDSRVGQNVDISCEESQNSDDAINKLKNHAALHIFPIPMAIPDDDDSADDNEIDNTQIIFLESLSVGAMTITFESDLMEEWLPEGTGLRIPLHPTDSTVQAQIEEVIMNLLGTIAVPHRVSAGRAARYHFLRLRNHFFSAIAALDAAVCGSGLFPIDNQGLHDATHRMEPTQNEHNDNVVSDEVSQNRRDAAKGAWKRTSFAMESIAAFLY